MAGVQSCSTLAFPQMMDFPVVVVISCKLSIVSLVLLGMGEYPFACRGMDGEHDATSGALTD